MDVVPDTEKKYLLERNKALCGIFRIPLCKLKHEGPDVNPRQLDLKNVQRLLNIFELEGCLRMEPDNYVPALIPRALLPTVPKVAGGLADWMIEPPVFDPPESLYCLHGRHRIEAARQYLSLTGKWWVVYLYVEEHLSSSSRITLRGETYNAKSFFDGDIYRHLRICQQSGDQSGKKKWLSRLSDVKRRDVLQLEKRAEKCPQTKAFQQKLDGLIPYRGLWPALRIGTFHRLLSLRCPEEMGRYLDQIQQTWDRITSGNDTLRLNVDMTTVQCLEGRLPLDPTDRAFIESHRLEIFPTIQDSYQRNDIWHNILSVDSIIPSIFTFLEDTKYLEVCAKILKRLLPDPLRGTLHQRFYQLHNGKKVFKAQLAEQRFQDNVENSSEVAHWKAYRQLWLYAMRHFPEMIGHTLRTEISKPKIKLPGLEYGWWYGITELAKINGYQSIQERFSSEADADMQMTKNFLHRVRPSSVFQIHSVDFDRTLRQIVNLLQEGYNPGMPDGQSGKSGLSSLDTNHRCGIPFSSNFDADKSGLFLHEIYHNRSTDNVVTSLLVKTTMFKNFFGHIDFSRLPDSEEVMLISPGPPGPSQTPQTTEAGDNAHTGSGAVDAGQIMSTGSSLSVPLQTRSTSPHAGTSNPPGLISSKRNAVAMPRTQFTRPARSNFEAIKTLTGISKADAVKLYSEYKGKKDDSALYVIREDCENEQFSVYYCKPQDTETLLEILDTEQYILPVPIRHMNRYGTAEYSIDRLKKIKISSVHAITTENPFCVLATKKNTKVVFEEDRLENTQNSGGYEIDVDYPNT